MSSFKESCYPSAASTISKEADCSKSGEFHMQSKVSNEKMDFVNEARTASRQNGVMIPVLDTASKMSYPHTATTDGADNVSGDSSTNLNSPLGSDEMEIDLSNISPLSSVPVHTASNISHPYFSTLDNRQNKTESNSDDSIQVHSANANRNTNTNANANADVTEGGGISRPLAPINIALDNTKRHENRHYSHTPNILSSDYAFGQKSFTDGRAVDLEYHEFENRNQRAKKYHGFNVNQLNLGLTNNHGASSQCVSGHPTNPNQAQSHHTQQTTSPLTPHSVHTAVNSPHSVHTSHSPNTPRSMNHAFPRFTPYSTGPPATTSTTGLSTTASLSSWGPSSNSAKAGNEATTAVNVNQSEAERAKQQPDGHEAAAKSPSRISPRDQVQNGKESKKVSDSRSLSNGHGQCQCMPHHQTQSQQQEQQQQQQQQQQMQSQNQSQVQQQCRSSQSQHGIARRGMGMLSNGVMAHNKPSQHVPTPSPRSSCGASPRPPSYLNSGPRLNYEQDGLSAADVEEVLSQLDIRPDTLRDSSTDFRPVFSCIRPIVCHKSNTPFYAQCSTAKLGYCTWCRQLRRGNQKQGSICLNCGERLTAKYHRWYPHLVRLEPLEKTRTKKMYLRYKPVFERFGITWHNEKQFEFVIDHYMLMKIYLSTENFNIEPLHLERTYMIGVFAGREFNTGALARKLLREGTKLAMFRADFPDYYDFLRDERAAVAEQMNLRFFQGVYKCYFHAHYTNIEGWYDPSAISRESIIDTFKELCNTILAHTALAHINQNGVKGPHGQRNQGGVRKYGGKGSHGGNGPMRRGRGYHRGRSGYRGGNMHHQQMMHNRMMNGQSGPHYHAQSYRGPNGHLNGMGRNMNDDRHNEMMQQNMNMNVQMQHQQHQQQQLPQRQQQEQHPREVQQQQQQQQQQQYQNSMVQGNQHPVNGMVSNSMPGMLPSQSWGAVQGVNPMNNLQNVIPSTVNPVQLNGAVKIPPLSLVNPQNNQPAQVQMSPPQQPQQSPRQQPTELCNGVMNGQHSPVDNSKQSQLLAGTQSMLNGISAITSVPVPAITPIGKVKTFQFGSPNGGTPQAIVRTNSQTQISRAYLPPLATTPRFAVPTPRGTAGAQYHTINLNMANMNVNSASPIQIQPQSSQSSTVSMPASNSYNGPVQIRRVSSHPITRKEDSSGDQKAKNGDKNEQNDAVKRIVLASSPRAGGGQQMKAISPRVADSAKAALNAGAAPFMIYNGNQVSPPVSPRNFNTPGFVVPPPPPHPHSFQFPPPPLPQGAANWLPLPQSTNQANHNGVASTINMPSTQGLMINTNMTPINMGSTNFTPKEQPMNMIVNNNRSPMFTPTHSPQFQSQPFQSFAH